MRTIKEMAREWELNIKSQYPVFDYELYQTATFIGMMLAWDELTSQSKATKQKTEKA